MRLFTGWLVGVITTVTTGVVINWLSSGLDPVCGPLSCSSRVVPYAQAAAVWLGTGDNAVKLAWIAGAAVLSLLVCSYVDTEAGLWGLAAATLSAVPWLPWHLMAESGVTWTAVGAFAGLAFGLLRWIGTALLDAWVTYRPLPAGDGDWD